MTFETTINGWHMETTAPTPAKAKQNFRYRLWKNCGWTRYAAMRAELDIKEK
jgi:hypothetical protein